jgi:hypothetical protein
MILTGKIFKFRYSVDGYVQPPLIVTAPSMTDADAEVLLHGERQAMEKLAKEQGQRVEFSGAHVRILAATEIDVDTL